MPEAAAGGPLAAIRDGDVISIALYTRRIDLLVDGTVADAALIRRRLADSPPVLAPAPRGWLSIYRANVQPIENTGATIVRPGPG